MKILKLFFFWLIENDISTILAVKIRAIRPPGTVFQTTTPDEILTPEEVKAMIEACQGSRDRSRDRAIIATLY